MALAGGTLTGARVPPETPVVAWAKTQKIHNEAALGGITPASWARYGKKRFCNLELN